MCRRGRGRAWRERHVNRLTEEGLWPIGRYRFVFRREAVREGMGEVRYAVPTSLVLSVSKCVCGRCLRRRGWPCLGRKVELGCCWPHCCCLSCLLLCYSLFVIFVVSYAFGTVLVGSEVNFLVKAVMHEVGISNKERVDWEDRSS